MEIVLHFIIVVVVVMVIVSHRKNNVIDNVVNILVLMFVISQQKLVHVNSLQHDSHMMKRQEVVVHSIMVDVMAMVIVLLHNLSANPYVLVMKNQQVLITKVI